MKKLTKEQKELILQKLEESGQFPNLVQKAKKDPEQGGDDKEWNQARKKVVSGMMRESNSRFFKVAPLLDKRTVQSKRTEWLYDNKDNVGFVFIVIGTALIFLDPGTFAARGDAPYIQGPLDYLALVQYILNWGAMGWMGAICMLGGYIFSRHPQLFMD
ncbi:MAG: hypothetical protein OEZ04_09100 [Nitrospinota bacterium]|nr:hypothetical protein [Nitrospinota bacterium]